MKTQYAVALAVLTGVGLHMSSLKARSPIPKHLRNLLRRSRRPFKLLVVAILVAVERRCHLTESPPNA